MSFAIQPVQADGWFIDAMKALLLLTVAFFTLYDVRAASVRYRCVALGSGIARGLNDLGEVVGYYPSTYGFTAFYWNGVIGTPRVALAAWPMHAAPCAREVPVRTTTGSGTAIAL